MVYFRHVMKHDQPPEPRTFDCDHALPPLEILYEDNHLLAVVKPVGLPTMGVVGKPTLLEVARDYIRHRYHKPGNVYLGVVSRLDAPVSGVVLLARTSKAAARLNAQFRTREVTKVYWALVEHALGPSSGNCVDWLVKDERHRRMHVADANAARAQEAQLNYRELARVRRATLLEIELLTGRKHQIRVQLASRDAPVLGDRKYGSQRKFPSGIALHSRRLVFEHPVRHEPVELVAPLPACWQQLGVRDELKR